MTKKANNKVTADRSKQIREELGLTQIEIVEKLGISQSAWSQVENGTNGLSNSVRKMLIDILGISQNFIDKGILPIKSPVKAEKIESNFDLEERKYLIEQINSLKAAIKDKEKIIKLYEERSI